jgi:hypothetical protein
MKKNKSRISPKSKYKAVLEVMSGHGTLEKLPENITCRSVRCGIIMRALTRRLEKWWDSTRIEFLPKKPLFKIAQMWKGFLLKTERKTRVITCI